jgi:hypothetical protein
MTSIFDMSEMRIAKPRLVNKLVFRNFLLVALQGTRGRTQALETVGDQAKKAGGSVRATAGP